MCRLIIATRPGRTRSPPRGARPLGRAHRRPSVGAPSATRAVPPPAPDGRPRLFQPRPARSRHERPDHGRTRRGDRRQQRHRRRHRPAPRRRAGFHVFCAARRADRVAALAAEIGGTAVACDVTSAATWPRSPTHGRRAARRPGQQRRRRVRVGPGRRGRRRRVAGDVRGQRDRPDAGHPGAAAGAARRGGRASILNVGSTAGRVAYEGGAGYTAAKHGTQVVTETLRLELFDQPVRVCEIAPGMVAPRSSRWSASTATRKGPTQVYAGVAEPLTADDVADAITWMVTRPPHVNIDELVLARVAQAAQHKVHRSLSSSRSPRAPSRRSGRSTRSATRRRSVVRPLLGHLGRRAGQVEVVDEAVGLRAARRGRPVTQVDAAHQRARSSGARSSSAVEVDARRRRSGPAKPPGAAHADRCPPTSGAPGPPGWRGAGRPRRESTPTVARPAAHGVGVLARGGHGGGGEARRSRCGRRPSPVSAAYQIRPAPSQDVPPTRDGGELEGAVGDAGVEVDPAVVVGGRRRSRPCRPAAGPCPARGRRTPCRARPCRAAPRPLMPGRNSPAPISQSASAALWPSSRCLRQDAEDVGERLVERPRLALVGQPGGALGHRVGQLVGQHVDAAW